MRTSIIFAPLCAISVLALPAEQPATTLSTTTTAAQAKETSWLDLAKSDPIMEDFKDIHADIDALHEKVSEAMGHVIKAYYKAYWPGPLPPFDDPVLPGNEPISRGNEKRDVAATAATAAAADLPFPTSWIDKVKPIEHFDKKKISKDKIKLKWKTPTSEKCKTKCKKEHCKTEYGWICRAQFLQWARENLPQYGSQIREPATPFNDEDHEKHHVHQHRPQHEEDQEHEDVGH